MQNKAPLTSMQLEERIQGDNETEPLLELKDVCPYELSSKTIIINMQRLATVHNIDVQEIEYLRME